MLFLTVFIHKKNKLGMAFVHKKQIRHGVHS